MKLVHTINEVREEVKLWKNQGFTVGFVPTMGYLHEGHESLIKRAVMENDKVVVSIFVNPIQFGPTEDLDKYPRDIHSDSILCEKAGAALIFNPDPSEMYNKNSSTYISVDALTEGLCGEKRPGHFTGVCTVVSKLFNIVTPNKAYFGEKDAQQLAVIKRMVIDLNFNIEIIGCPIIRESDGLAKSSRNTYLSHEERKAALILSKSLNLTKKALEAGERNAPRLKELITNELRTEALAKVDYVEIVDSTTLKQVSVVEKDILVAIAVYIGKTRLIDNFTFKL